MTAAVYWRDYALFKVKLTATEYFAQMAEFQQMSSQFANMLAYYKLAQADAAETKLMDSSPLALYASRNEQPWVSDASFVSISGDTFTPDW